MRNWTTHRIVVATISVIALIAGGFLIQRAVVGRPHPAGVAAPPASSDASPSADISATQAPSLSPAPSPSPSPSKAKPALPPRPPLPIPAGFPSPSNTGWKHTGVTLTPVNGLYIADKPGEVLDAKDFRGGVRIKANNVTVKRSRVQCGNCPGVWIDWYVQNALIEDVEITSKSKTERIDRALTAGKTINLTVRRVYAHDTQRGIEYGYSALIEDSYVDDQYNPTEAHVSAVGGALQDRDMKLVIRHNWIAGKPGQNNSGALLYYIEGNARKLDVTIERNIINGGTYALWLSSDNSLKGQVTVRSNLFGTKYHDLCGAYNTHFTDEIHKTAGVALTWAGNVWYSPGNAKDGKEVTYHIQY